MIDPVVIGLVSATTALVASIAGPLVTLHIGRSQIKAAVLSTNRQKWIDNLRDLVATICAEIAAAMQVREKVLKEDKFSLADNPEILRRFEALVLTFTKIGLMINPMEEDHMKLLAAIQDILIIIQTSPPSHDIQAEGAAAGPRIVAITQTILKREWERVKHGT